MEHEFMFVSVNTTFQSMPIIGLFHLRPTYPSVFKIHENA